MCEKVFHSHVTGASSAHYTVCPGSFFSLNTSNSEPNQNTLPNLIKIHHPIWSKYMYTTQSDQNTPPDLIKIHVHYPIWSKYTTQSNQNALLDLLKIHYPIWSKYTTQSNQNALLDPLKIHYSGGVYTTTLLTNTVTLVFVSTEEVQHLHEVIFQCFINGS